MGIEALSRGADWADFVDRESRCCEVIRENLENTKLADRAHVYCVNVSKAISFLDKEYGIVIMDPPYRDLNIGETITQLAKSKLIGPDTTVVITHSPRLTLEPGYDSLTVVKERRHGDSCISVYRKEGK